MSCKSKSGVPAYEIVKRLIKHEFLMTGTVDFIGRRLADELMRRKFGVVSFDKKL